MFVGTFPITVAVIVFIVVAVVIVAWVRAGVDLYSDDARVNRIHCLIFRAFLCEFHDSITILIFDFRTRFEFNAT